MPGGGRPRRTAREGHQGRRPQDRALRGADRDAGRHRTGCLRSARTPGGPAGIRLGTGPTTGLIVHADGYIISSAFNFANKPQAIHCIRARPQGALRRRDRRQRSDAHADTAQARWTSAANCRCRPLGRARARCESVRRPLAVGRTLIGHAEHMPSVSVGIISALNRIWGKAIQTDAKVSPINYGGPLIDL